MSFPAHTGETARYPALPQSFLESAALALPLGGALRLRRFGTRLDDLRIDLAGGDRPRTITEILECCTVPGVGREFSWDLPVGKRIECLLVLAALDGVTQLDADLRCPSCRQTLEVTLTVEELLEAGLAATDLTIEVEMGGTTRRFRRPTGRDQLAWMQRTYPDEATVRREMVASLALTDGAFSGADLTQVEAALDHADPLLRSAVLAECPDCGQSTEHEVDLAGFALGRLRRAQDALLATVHVMASRYHWSEADILSIPEWRRTRYLAMLDSRGARVSYLAALMRQTGIPPGAAAPLETRRAPADVYGIDVEETRVTEPTAGRSERVTEPATPILSARIGASAPAPQPGRGGERGSREHVVQGHGLEDGARPEAVAPPSVAETSDAPLREKLPAPVVRIRSAKPTPSDARPRPTLSDVRAWVSQPLEEARSETTDGVTQHPAASSSMPAPREASGDRKLSTAERVDNQTLEIGTIQITFEEPAAVPRVAAPSRREAPTAAQSRASRHYLR